jgi:hypothetical protein
MAVGAVIKGCEAVPTTTVTPFVAKCAWVPAASGATVLGATLTPTDAVTYTSVDAAAFTVKVGIPVQGVVSPIHIYADTVLASGTTGVLAARFGVSCAITSQFIVGQTIVFRVYGNNETLGGAPMDSSNISRSQVSRIRFHFHMETTVVSHSGLAYLKLVQPQVCTTRLA